MWDESTKDNRQTAEYSRLDAKQRAGCLFLGKSSCLPLSNAYRVLFLFQLMYQQILDTNNILRKSNVELSRQDQTQLDSASESNKMRQSQAMLNGSVLSRV